MRPAFGPGIAARIAGWLSGAYLLLLALLPAGVARGAILRINSPGTLSLPDTKYILLNDVQSAGTCFIVNASNVVLDLGGHTVTYNTAAKDSVYGVLITWNKTGVRITDGTIRQGSGNGYQSAGVYGQQACNVEIDHLNLAYQGDNDEGISLVGGGFAQSANIHDNIIRPDGTKRAGQDGVITHFGDFAAIMVDRTGGVIAITNNDIEGKGYQGIHFNYSIPLSGTMEVTGNTVRMAAPVRDGYGVVVSSPDSDNVGFEIAQNTIVQSSGRGILVEGYVDDASPGPGLGTIHDNWIDVRESEDSGEYPGSPGVSTGICLRFGAHDIGVFNNTVTAWAGANAAPPQFPTQQGPACMARAFKIHSGVTSHNNVIYDNIATVSTTDSALTASALVAINTAAVPNVNEVFYNNVAYSNSFLVDLNCDDGNGNYQTFISNILVKSGPPEGFHSIRVGYSNASSVGNQFLDNAWEAGATGEDLGMSGAGGAPYSLLARTYLRECVEDANGNPVAGATVTATATGGGVETVAGTTDAHGRAQLIVTNYTRSGMTFPPTSNFSYFTPDSVITRAAGHAADRRSWVMTSSRELTIVLDHPATQPPAIYGLQASNLTSASATISWQTDVPAASRVDFGVDATYGNVVIDTSRVTNHSVVLGGLAPSVYHYRITATRAGSAPNQGTDHSFVLLAAPPPSPGPPVVDFSASPVNGSVPLSVSFADLSTGAPTSWSWTFGDGDSSQVRAPLHTYSTTGSYTVSLTARNTYGSNTTTKPAFITVNNTSGVTTLPPGLGPLAVSLIAPNPFRSRTTIAYTLPGQGRVALEVLDPAGRRVAVLCDEERSSGGRIDWTPTHCPPGTYFVRLSWNGQVRSAKIRVLG